MRASARLGLGVSILLLTAASAAAGPTVSQIPAAAPPAASELRLFPLENIEPEEALSVLRSVLEVHEAALLTSPPAVILRGTSERLSLAERLLRRIDQPSSEVEVAVRILTLNSAALAGGVRETRPLRLSAAELAAVEKRGAARVLAAPVLSAVGDGPALLEFDDLIERGGEKSPKEDVVRGQLRLEVRPRLHPASGESTLHVRLSLVGPSAAAGRSVAWHLRSSARLEDGQTLFLGGLGLTQGAGEVGPPSFAWLTDEGRVLAVTLSLRQVRTPWVASEGRGAVPVSR